MAKKPLNPDSVKGGGMPAMGRSSQGASAAANKRAGAGSRAAKLFEQGSKIAEARAKVQLKAAGLDVKTGLPVDRAAAAKLRAQGSAYRASLKSNRVTELEKRLNAPKAETKAALNKRLNKKFNTMFDYSNIVGKKAK